MTMRLEQVEQSLDDLKVALGVVVAFSAIMAVVSGVASKLAPHVPAA